MRFAPHASGTRLTIVHHGAWAAGEPADAYAQGWGVTPSPPSTNLPLQCLRRRHRGRGAIARRRRGARTLRGYPDRFSVMACLRIVDAEIQLGIGDGQRWGDGRKTPPIGGKAVMFIDSPELEAAPVIAGAELGEPAPWSPGSVWIFTPDEQAATHACCRMQPAATAYLSSPVV